jgi:GNAT superfamily N-acetyltransferase
LFAGSELVARIEQAECMLLAAAAAAARRRSPDDGVLELPISGGLATWVGASSPLNKLAGLGFGGEVDESELEAIERAFAAKGTPLQVELASLADPSPAAMLTARGYRLVGFENVLGLALPASRASTPGDSIEVRSSGEAELDAWIDAVVTGFANPDLQGAPSHESFPRAVIAAAMREVASADGFLRYSAWHRGVLAGGASMRLSGGVAQLCGAATLPEHRRRGVQSALLDARLAAAERGGCDLAVVTTQPGSRSQQNVQKLGFELLYTRAVLVLEHGTPSAADHGSP